MTEKEVEHLAIKAGLLTDDDFLQTFANLVAQHEREACAKVAQDTICDRHIPTGISIYGTLVAKAIRARGNT
jgi:hypothetical protein